MTSGRAPVSSTGETVGTGDIRAQARTVIQNCEAVLKGLGANLSDVVRVTIWLKNLEDYAGMNEEYVKLFAQPYPVRACVQARLIKDDWLVEMEMTALVTSPVADGPSTDAR
jgi:enamine deaminase RidA (YjgF/YER057c/UK114 family)